MVVVWWVVLQLVGLAVLPLTLRLFRNLPDRGWAFARPVGLLAVAYLFWLGATLGPLSNSWGSILGALLIVALASWLIGWREAVGLPDFLSAQRRRVVVVEVVFTAAFLLWTIVRAYNPDISATEKPMELTFLNGVLRSEQFPPLDPWLSGYAISYYYFGYVITGMLARFTGVPAQFAFNLMLPTLFALTATGAYAIGANLYAGRARLELPGALRRTIGSGLLALTLVLALANLEPVLEILNARQALSPEARAYFAIKDMPPGYSSGSLFPTDPPDSWWWFRATRVIGTQAPEGSRAATDYTINEFPIFSFILGDVHPHLLSLPFVLVALGFALTLLRAPTPLSLDALRRDWLTVLSAGVLFGGLGFLNAWDLPTFAFVVLLAFGTQALISRGPVAPPPRADALAVLVLAVAAPIAAVSFTALRSPEAMRWVAGALDDPSSAEILLRVGLLIGTVGAAVPAYWLVRRRRWAIEASGVLIGTLVLSLVLYLPFYLSFRSQASGLRPVPVQTQLRHFLLFWGPLYLVAASFLVYQLAATWRGGPRDWTRTPATWIATALLALASAALGAPVVAATLPLLVAALALLSRHLLGVQAQTADVEDLARPAGAQRARAAVAAGAGTPPSSPRPQPPITIAGGAVPLAVPREHLFAILLAFTGLLLIMGTELVFIQDLFNNRMNTVFKLYYQAWILLALAGAYALPFLFQRLRRHPIGIAWSGVLAVVLGLALLYPIGATLSKTRNFAGPPTLDGLQFWARSRPDDMDAIEWLSRNAVGAPVVVEATGGSYQQQFGRVSSMTGLPTLLGWAFHEQQWRGTFEEPGRRVPDIDAIYGCRRGGQGRCDPLPGDARQLQALLDKYNMTYVYVGPSEREAYGQIDLARFNQAMDVAYKNSSVVIYRNRSRSD